MRGSEVSKYIVTAGPRSSDIDVYACAIAYAELLRKEGKDAQALIGKEFTASITESLRKLDVPFLTEYIATGTESVVLVDVSDPKHIPQQFFKSQVIEVFDHRPMFINEWVSSPKLSVKIEQVGACATLIWEEVEKRGFAENISSESALLLLAAIVSNNLAMKSPLLTQRDRSAFETLKEKASISTTWVAEYFTEQEEHLYANLTTLVKADTKVTDSPIGPLVIGQIELWNASRLVAEMQQDLLACMNSVARNGRWFINIVSISEGVNYIFTPDEKTKKLLQENLSLQFRDNVAKTGTLLMRKQIMNKLTII